MKYISREQTSKPTAGTLLRGDGSFEFSPRIVYCNLFDRDNIDVVKNNPSVLTNNAEYTPLGQYVDGTNNVTTIPNQAASKSNIGPFKTYTILFSLRLSSTNIGQYPNGHRFLSQAGNLNTYINLDVEQTTISIYINGDYFESGSIELDYDIDLNFCYTQDVGYRELYLNKKYIGYIGDIARQNFDTTSSLVFGNTETNQTPLHGQLNYFIVIAFPATELAQIDNLQQIFEPEYIQQPELTPTQKSTYPVYYYDDFNRKDIFELGWYATTSNLTSEQQMPTFIKTGLTGLDCTNVADTTTIGLVFDLDKQNRYIEQILPETLSSEQMLSICELYNYNFLPNSFIELKIHWNYTRHVAYVGNESNFGITIGSMDSYINLQSVATWRFGEGQEIIDMIQTQIVYKASADSELMVYMLNMAPSDGEVIRVELYKYTYIIYINNIRIFALALSNGLLQNLIPANIMCSPSVKLTDLKWGNITKQEFRFIESVENRRVTIG